MAEERHIEDLGALQDASSGARIGGRIRQLRMERGLSQTELGSMVGLSGARVQQYESGNRKPKYELLQQIAEALQVSTLALMDPDTTTASGMMYALFEMESLYGLYPVEEDGEIKLAFHDDAPEAVKESLKRWYQAYSSYKKILASDVSDASRQKALQEYKDFERNFTGEEQ